MNCAIASCPSAVPSHVQVKSTDLAHFMKLLLFVQDNHLAWWANIRSFVDLCCQWTSKGASQVHPEVQCNTYLSLHVE